MAEFYQRCFKEELKDYESTSKEEENKSNNQNDLDEFKRALTMAMRSISKEDELTVSFGAETGSVNGLKARLPLPNKSMSSKQLPLRGEATQLPYLLHIIRRCIKNTYLKVKKAREIFNSLEKIRCEAIGSKEMAGVAKIYIRWKEQN